MASRDRTTMDDFNLSLTGSGIQSAASTHRSRPGSAKNKRPSSVTDMSTGRESKPASARKKTTGNTSAASTHRSEFSDFSSVSTSKKGTAARSSKGPRDDFLALFESSTQPKIKGTSAGSKKPSSTANKVLWSSPAGSKALKSKFTPKTMNSKPAKEVEAAANLDVFHDQDEWLTNESNTHSIFQQKSARSSSDEEGFSFKDRLSQSFSNRGRKSSSDQESFKKGDNTDKGLSPRVANNNIPRTSSQGAIANNMTLQGMSKGVKVGLSDLENSYQNIKHKTPVNQTRKSQSSAYTPGAYINSANSMVEDHIKKVNMAATQIQRWFRRHSVQNKETEVSTKAGEAALQRLLQSKKQTFEEQRLRESQNDFFAKEMEERGREDRKRNKEERAKMARQEAIKELHRKREEKREDVKKKAEEELAFLTASGKITKKTGLGKKKGTKPVSKKSKGDNDANINTHDGSSPERDNRNVERNNDDSMDEYYQNHIENTANGSERVDENEAGSHVAPSDSVTKTTLDDLFETLKKLEEEEQLATARPERKNAWLEDIEKALESDGDNPSLNAENLHKFNSQKADLPTKASLLSDDKMKSIMAFLDEVQVSERLSTVDQEISKLTSDLDRPTVGPTQDEFAELEQVNAAASEVTNTVLSQRLELDEKKRSVSMLQKALNQQRELTVRHARETDKEMKHRLDLQKEEYEETIKRHLSFIDQLIDDKKTLSERCETLVKELKQVDKKYQDRIKAITDKHNIDMQKLKDMHEAAEKLRRERWIEEKTKKIKEMTVKGLEPEIQRLIAKHKSELKKIKQIHEAELLESDERAAQKYVRMTEELRDQLASEKESACARERELAKQRYEKQVQQEEEAYQQQRRRLMTEVQEEKDRVAKDASRQRADIDRLQQQLQDKHSYAMDAMRIEFDKAREEQEKRHAAETKELKERMEIEKATWEENYRKKQETFLMQRERELKEGVKKDRNKEIELVIRQLEEDATAAREDCERVAENRIKRIREKYESEMREVERSEKQALERYNEMKARLTEVDGENECLKVYQKQKDQEIKELQKLTDKMHKERDRVSDIIRQEFADRLVFTEEENKRIKNEMSELKARQRIELDKAKDEIEDIKKMKDDEMEEVHKRVKQAIVKKEEVVTQLKQQYQAAQKRADHLEGLLQQQRKQLLNK
ncbi:CP131-like protein [Mya arenaria]|uniref:CP131-like protein n=1 Tax=Mya arenaria TaxID=6604 RepID=A0ABY7DGS3_MYAAR|nr:centrosomal protein of 131 kDa-like [Mya arenaria]WAQ95629.1 CP131-like protein [Mya arenaria]